MFFILIAVWTATVSQKSIIQNWQGTTDVVIIPIAADSDKITKNYLERLAERDFKQIRKFFKREIKRYRPDLSHIITIRLSEQIKNTPPLPPKMLKASFKSFSGHLKYVGGRGEIALLTIIPNKYVYMFCITNPLVEKYYLIPLACKKV